MFPSFLPVFFGVHLKPVMQTAVGVSFSCVFTGGKNTKRLAWLLSDRNPTTPSHDRNEQRGGNKIASFH